jgi:hypothetical protein
LGTTERGFGAEHLLIDLFQGFPPLVRIGVACGIGEAVAGDLCGMEGPEYLFLIGQNHSL